MKRTLLIALLMAGGLGAQTPDRPELPRLYIEPLVSIFDYYTSVTQTYQKAVLKQCGGSVTITTSPFRADFILSVQAGASTIKGKDGDILKVLNTSWKLSNLAKEVCAFIETVK